MVYNFSLPPLLLDAFHRGDAGTLGEWAAAARVPRGGSFLNFLSSHDGIGLIPAHGYLSDEHTAALVELARERGGFVSFRSGVGSRADSQQPYELNIPWLDAVSDPEEDENIRLRKLITSQCAMLSLAGVPAVYINTLLGAPADREAALRSGVPRVINRRKLALEKVQASLRDGRDFSARAFREQVRCLSVRRSHPAFHPAGAQEVIKTPGALFALLRTSPNGRGRVLCAHNLGARPQPLAFDAAVIGAGQDFRDILTGNIVYPRRLGESSLLAVDVPPYQSLWLARP
jgi:sucrose phosphorylase